MASASNEPETVSMVTVSNFVSVKLDGRENYSIWKAQMLCLIECVELLYIINAESPVDKGDPMISQYDELVKGWIFATLELEESVVKDVQDLGTAREVWMKIESIFNQRIGYTEEGDSSNVSPQTEGYKYRSAFHGAVYFVTVSNFVSVKLSGHNNYHIWKAQMICLLESLELLHIINADYPFPVGKGVHMILQYDKLVKGWIFGSMEEKVLKDFIDYSSVQSIWRQLETRFNRPISYTEGDSVDVSALREDLKYIQVSNVNVSNFVSVKLSGYNNHRIWKAQMMCLLESQELLHIIEVKARSLLSLDFCGHITKKYDNLVKGWILGTMNDQLLKTFAGYDSVQLIWKKLESKVFTPEIDTIDGTYALR
ncbi:uncharacterized protein LOC143569953 [Bidens hawaiensis]|uniref:uncharacterized protein LOC143569953 n=1 Tax=Bidens hawaiensis TaxID=980011 RepID=UPI00404A31D1